MHMYLKEKEKKLDDKGTQCIFVGYYKKAYKLYNLVANKMIVSRDVRFDETSPLEWTKEEKQQLGISVDFEDLSFEESDLIAPPMSPPPPISSSSASPSTSLSAPPLSIPTRRNPP